jgi:hypothetical protein
MLADACRASISEGCMNISLCVALNRGVEIQRYCYVLLSCRMLAMSLLLV